MTSPETFEQIQREYRSHKAHMRDAARLAADGWEIASFVEVPQRVGCLRILCLGVFAWLFKPKPVLLVTYVRRWSGVTAGGSTQ